MLLVSSLLSPYVYSDPWMCGEDLTGDGEVTQAHEIAVCRSVAGGQLCPINAVACQTNETCPINTSLSCVNGACQQAVTCQEIGDENSTLYQCPLNGDQYDNTEACVAACIRSEPCTPTPPSCPIGDHPCLEVGDNQFQCSENTCTDQADNVVEAEEIDSRIYVDDGNRSSDGACLDQVMIFAGRNMECRTAGASTAYTSCCEHDGEVLTDSTGSISELSQVTHTVKTTWQAASAAWSAYSETKNAADATSAANNVFKAAFDPASIAISLAVGLFLDYLMNSCNQMDTETAMLNSSGYCYATGDYCKTDRFGVGCVQRANTYCCFNSKLARIIHEQGRPQLASFNGSEKDNCRGFSPEEFQYLDFSRIDLSDYYDDLKTLPQSLMQGNLQDGVQDFYDQLP